MDAATHARLGVLAPAARGLLQMRQLKQFAAKRAGSAGAPANSKGHLVAHDRNFSCGGGAN
jgi:hypothetical protein